MEVVPAPHPPTDLRPRPRWPLVLVVLASSCWLGLVIGAAVSAKWLVPAGSGLAGPAMVLGYGCVGAIAALLLAGALAWKASYGVLRAAALGVLALALVAAVLVGWRVAEVTRDGEAQGPPISPGDAKASSADPTPQHLVPVNQAVVEQGDEAVASDGWIVLSESPSATGEPLVVAGEVVPPQAVHRVSPDFAPLDGIRVPQGVTIVQAVIGADGTVERVRVLRSVHPEFDRAILAAVSQWKFEPATLDGEPVAVYYNLTMTVHFR